MFSFRKFKRQCEWNKIYIYIYIYIFINRFKVNKLFLYIILKKNPLIQLFYEKV